MLELVPIVPLKSMVPESEVDSQISQLNYALVDLDQFLGTLGVRLEPVLSPYASGSDCSDCKAEQNLSPIADRIRTAKYRVQSLSERVKALLGSLAV